VFNPDSNSLEHGYYEVEIKVTQGLKDDQISNRLKQMAKYKDISNSVRIQFFIDECHPKKWIDRSWTKLSTSHTVIDFTISEVIKTVDNPFDGIFETVPDCGSQYYHRMYIDYSHKPEHDIKQ
jgi:hypothetical protein